MPILHVSTWKDNAPGPSPFLSEIGLREETGMLSSANFGFPLRGRELVCKTHVPCPCHVVRGLSLRENLRLSSSAKNR